MSISTGSRFVRSCAVAALFLLCTEPLHAFGKPKWVKKRPEKPGSYIGIGMTAKGQLSADEYMGKARNSALFDLASEIMVGISGEFVLEVTERTGMTEEQVQAEMKSVARANLMGHKVADTWGDRKEYWVFYALSRRDYQAMIEEQKRKAFEAASAMKKKAVAENQKGNLSTSMRFYLRALGEMQDVMAHPPTAGDRTRNALLEVDDIYATLQKSLGGFHLAAGGTRIYGLVGAPVAAPLEVAVKTGGHPVAGLPVRFAFTSGSGEMSESVQTDRDGVAR